MSAAPAWANRIVGSGEEAPDQLLANPGNWRTHPKAQREALREVLDTVGYVAQVIVNQRTGHLVDGHLRVEEALSHGQPTIPVLYVDLSEDEERLVLASLDPLAAMATTDEAKLRELLAEVSVDSEALAAMLAALAPAEPKDGLTDPDDVPEPPDEAITKPGDLWLLGEHRLLCGDAGCEADLDRLLDGVTVDLLLTDPPYNVKVEPRSNNAIAAGMAAQLRRVVPGRPRLVEPQARDEGARRAGAPPLGLRRGPRQERHPPPPEARSRASSREGAGDPPQAARQGPAPGQRLHQRRRLRGAAAGLVRERRAGPPPRWLASTSGAATRTSPTTRPRLKAAGLYFSQAIIWDKEHPVLTRKDFMGSPRVGLLRLEGGRRPPLLRPTERAPTCGTSRRSARTRWSTSPRSRSSWRGGRSSTARCRARSCSTRSRARARRSSPASRPGGGRTSWRSTRCTATSWSPGSKRSAGRRPSGSPRGRGGGVMATGTPPARTLRPGLPRRLARHPHHPSPAPQAATTAQRRVRARLRPRPHRRRGLARVPRVVAGLRAGAEGRARACDSRTSSRPPIAPGAAQAVERVSGPIPAAAVA